MNRPYLILGLLWTAYMLNYVDRQMVFSWFPVLRRDSGFTDTQLGLIGTVFLWSYSFCAPFAGRVADRVSRPVLIAASIAAWSLATIGTGSSGTPGAFLFWRGVVGVTEGFYFPAAVAALVTVFGDALRGRAIAMHGSAQFAGIAVGGWLGGWIAQTAGWRDACFAMGGIGLLYSFIVWRRLPRAEATAMKPVSVAPRAGRLPACLAAIAVAFFVMCAMLWMQYAWLADTIHGRFGLDLAASGWNATLFLQVSSAAGLLTGGPLGDRLRRKRVAGRLLLVALGLLLASPFAWLVFHAGTLATVRAATLCFGAFSGIMLSNVIASAYDLVSESRYGITAGTMTLVGGLGGGAAMLAAGAWRTALGPERLMAWTGIASAAVAVGLFGLTSRFAREAATR